MKKFIKALSCILCLSLLFSHASAFAKSAMSAQLLDYSYPNTHVNTGNYQDDLLAVAETQIGYIELSEKNGIPVIDSQTPYYTKYGESYGNPRGHWCAFFVLWCAAQANIPTSIICKSAACGSCRAFVEWFKSNHRWKDNLYTPQKGDIVFFDWDNDGYANHVGIVQAVEGNTVTTIEGNTGGINGYTVMRCERSENILGYGVPNYELRDKINGYATAASTAYMLPNSSSSTVWEIWRNDELQILCRDEDYYLVLYPYVYTGKFVAAYVPVTAVSLNAAVPTAEDFYSISKTVILNKPASVYHNASDEDLTTALNSNLRALLNQGDEITVLFEEDGFYFIKTDSITGYISKADITLYDDVVLSGDINGDKKTDSADAGLILRHDAGLIDLSDSQLNCADVNHDKKVDSADAGIILRHDAGLIDVLQSIKLY